MNRLWAAGLVALLSCLAVFVGGDPARGCPPALPGPEPAPQVCPDGPASSDQTGGALNQNADATSAGASCNPVLYASGIVLESGTDAYLPGVTFGWQHTRRYNSRLVAASGSLVSIQGQRWEVDMLTTCLRQKDVNGDGRLDVEVYLDAAHKRVFTKNPDNSYSAPPDYRATLKVGAGSHLVLTLTESGMRFWFRDFDDQKWGEAKGLLHYRVVGGNLSEPDPENPAVPFETYGYDETDKRLRTITTSQGWLVVYGCISTSPNTGKIETIEVKKPLGGENYLVLQKVTYTYFATGMGYSPEVGTEGDLILVRVQQKVAGDTGDDFSIDRYTHYRYYDTDDADGREHQVKMVLEPAAMQALLEKYPALSAADVLTKGDTQDLEGEGEPDTVAEFASRTFKYYIAGVPTSQITTEWAGGQEDLESKYGGSNFDETGYVKSETVAACGGCGGVTTKFYYMNLNEGASEDPNVVVRLLVQDIADETTEFVRRRILGMNTDRVVLRDVTATWVDPGENPYWLYWCTSTVLGSNKTNGTYNRIGQRRLVSAHTKVTDGAGNIGKFLNPTGDDWNNEASTRNGTGDSDTGVIYQYTYHSGNVQGQAAWKGYLDSEKIKNTKTGTEYYLRKVAAYGDGTNNPVHYPVTVYTYPEETDSAEAASKLTTTYTYYYRGDPVDINRLKVKKTTYPIVTSSNPDHHGSGSATETLEYYDEGGRLRLTKDGAGHVTYYGYDLDTGGLTYQVEDIKTQGFTEDAPDNTTPWSEVSADLSGGGWSFATSSGLNLATKYAYDDQGRQTEVADADGATTYTVHKDRQTLVFRAWDTGTNRPLLPIEVSETDEEGREIRSYTVDPARAAVDGGKPTGLLTGTDQDDYYTLTVRWYDDKGQLDSVDRYFDIPAGEDPGTEGEDFYRTRYEYNAMGGLQQVIAEDGTITWTVYDKLGRSCQQWVGTDAEDGTDGDPSNSGANNMKQVSQTYYDGATSQTPLLVGDGHVTKTIAYADGSTSYATEHKYDWRGRRTDTRGPDDVAAKLTLDNMGRTVTAEVYVDGGTEWVIDAGELRAKSQAAYDQKGQVWQTKVYSVAGGTADTARTTNYWSDADGRQIKVKDPDGLLTKTTYDGAGRVTATYLSYDQDETDYEDAGSVSGDEVIEQTQTQYNVLGQPWLVTYQRRKDNASGTGALTPNADGTGRPHYTAYWYQDKTHRLTCTAFYGTNGGTVLDDQDADDFDPDPNIAKTYLQCKANLLAPGTASSDGCIITRYEYDDRGHQHRTTDNKGQVTQLCDFDDLGRPGRVVENHDDGTLTETENDTDRTTQYAYGPGDRLEKITARNPKGSGNNVEDQDTKYVYGATLTESDVARNDLLRAVIYPDSDDATSPLGNGNDQTYDRVEYKYDRLGRRKWMKDQRQVVHEYKFDAAGRLKADKVAAYPAGVDSTVLSITRAYDTFGRLTKITSHSSPTENPETDVVNQVVFGYDGDDQGDTGWGGVKTSWQSHGGAADTEGEGQSPKVQYAYRADAPRLAQVTYPGGRNVYYNYAASGFPLALGRLDNIADDDDGTTKYAQYAYIGAGTVVKVTHPALTAAGLELTYTDGPGSYPGFDRFDRIVNQKWQKTDTTLLDGYAYDYDRASNRASRKNLHPSASALDELYGYDGLNRLTSFQRGAITGTWPDLSLSTKVQKRQWLLEALGNWRQFQVNSNYAEDEDYTDAGDLNQARTHNKVNEIHNATPGAAITEGTSPPQAAWVDPVHDAAGNMTQAPLAGSGGDLSAGQTRLHLVYDAWNRQAVVKNNDGQGGPGTDRVVCRYDGLGRRIVKVDKTGQSEVTYHYYYNEAWQVLEERIGDDPDPYAQYVWDARYIDAPILRWRDTSSPPDGQVDETLYFTNDANMNVTAAVDASSTVQERTTYDAYGTPTFRDASWNAISWSNSRKNEILFCGYRYDPQTGHYHVRYRLYHPDLGRWGRRDPAEEGMNLFEYVASEPNTGRDPSGLRGVKGHERCLLVLFFSPATVEAARIEEGVPEDVQGGPLIKAVAKLATKNGFGITFGRTMYFPEGRLDTGDMRGMAWLAHEVRHTEQYAAFGNRVLTYLDWYTWYLRQGKFVRRGMQAYQDNPFENDARVFGDCMLELLLAHEELRRDLSIKDDEERAGCICNTTDNNWEKYKKAVEKCLGKAKKMKTSFTRPGSEIEGEFEFYLKGKYTGPVGRKVDMVEDDYATPPPGPPARSPVPGWDPY